MPRSKTAERLRNCDRAMVDAFDYSSLDAAFTKLSKPAQRALVNHKILTPRDLAKWSLADLKALHGVGPSSLPILQAALKTAGLKFNP